MERRWGELSEECKHRWRVSGVEVQGGHVYQEQRPWRVPSCFHRFPDVGLERRRRRDEGGGGWGRGGEGRVAEKRMWWHQQQQQVKHRAAATEGLDAHWFLLSAVNTNRLVQDDVWQLTEWNGENSSICCLNIVAPLCFHNDITCSQCTTWRLAEWQERLTCNMIVRAVFSLYSFCGCRYLTRFMFFYHQNKHEAYSI